MIKHLIVTLILCILFPLMAFSESQSSVERYELNPAKNYDFKYGSGLSYKKSSPYGGGILMFYLTPSGDFQITDGKDKRNDAEIPHVAIAKLKKKKGTFEVSDRFPLYFEKADSLNVNLEGISTAPDDILWLVDSKQNALIKVDLETGAIKQVVKPGEGLPEILKQSVLKSVAVAPGGKVYTIAQSPLIFAGNASSTVKFIRLVEFNPENNSTKTYALPFEQSNYASASEVKIDDLQAIDNNRFLALEQGRNSKGKQINRVFLIELTGASDISGLKFGDQELEFATTDVFGENQLITKPLGKKLLVDLNELGWNYSSAEGLALLDAETIAVTNGNAQEGETAKTEVWLISLPEALYDWSWREWALFLILGFILVFSTVLTFLFVFKKNQV